ncbi:MAG: DUF5606 domain-containing protein [Muribaculaceae bacterium]|nr:DUF5606 domain-containing protein [Muribaculaceae bacterium]
MLKKILSISGRPGLYKLVSYGKNMLLVESLVDGKRFPVHSRERVMSLGDISMYTTADDIPLSQVFENVGKKYENKPLDAKAYASPDQLHEFMAGVLENWDEERIHNSDIKKVIAWYNVLIGAGITDFAAKEEEAQAEEPTEEKKD